MSTSNTIAKFVGEKGKVFRFTVKEDGQIVDIEGNTVTLEVEDHAARSVSVVDGQNGRADYTTTLTDFPDPGGFEAQLKMVTLGGNTFYSRKFLLQVLETTEG